MGLIEKNEIIADYRLEKLISKNNLSASWSAVDTFTGRRVFLKISNSESTLDPEEIREISVGALQRQRRIKSQAFITSRGYRRVKGDIIAEYPWLDSKLWSPINPEIISNDIPGTLLEMALALDYLHRLGLVHCDVKSDNFHLSRENGRLKTRLGDLEFLASQGDSCKAKIFGTADHIAPEILRGDKISIYADIYSYGVLLKHLRLRLIEKKHLTADSELAAKIEKLSQQATREYLYDRPPVLIDALKKYGIIDGAQYQQAVDRLFYSFLIAAFLQHRTALFNGRMKLVEFFDNYKIMGLSAELINDLEAGFHADPLAVFTAAKGLFKNCSISLHFDYWHLEYEQNSLRKLYRELAEIIKLAPTAIDGNQSIDIEGILDRAINDGVAKYPLKSYLLLSDLLKKLPEPKLKAPSGQIMLLYETLADLSAITGDFKRTHEFYGKAIASAPDKTIANEINLKFATYLAASGSSTASMKVVADAPFIGEQISLRNAKHLLLKAYLLASMGEYGQSRELIDTIRHYSQAQNDPVILYKIHNVLGNIAKNQGKIDDAIGHYEKSLSYFDESDEKSPFAPSLLSLLGLYNGSAKYENTYRTAGRAISNYDAVIPDLKLKYIYLLLAESCLRLGKVEEADDWHQRSLSIFLRGFDSRSIEFLYSWEVLYFQNASMPQQAIKKGFAVLGLSANDGNILSAVTLPSMCLSYIFIGDKKQALEYAQKAMKYFEKRRDYAMVEETKLLIALNEFLYTRNTVDKDVDQLVKLLIPQRSYYYSALGYFMLAMKIDGDPLKYDRELPRALREIADGSQNPIFRAIIILDSLSGLEVADPIFIIDRLKQAYTILDDTRQYFFAFFLSTRIARIYQKLGNHKLALKYFNNSRRLAANFDNRLLESTIDRLSAESGADAAVQNNASRILAGINTLLSDVADYEQSLKAILQFAVDQTGAERGALLLKRPESDKLYVKKYVNCHLSQIEDIAKISNSIPQHTMDMEAPVAISDAGSDDRTKNAKSVIEHNIKSVICIPLKFGEKPLGVIYLDHHVIPALFDDSEIQLAKTLARIISLVLVTTEDIRTLKHSTEELREQLQSAGLSQPGVFASQKMIELVEKLPSIARSNAAVLITGESGTGKDVLAKMIHSLSRRKDKTLIRLNCASIAPDLVESELFGIADNVATNVRARKGKFAAADGGTLFLDEIGDMPLNMQAKILHAVENQQFQAVGSNETIHTDIRFIYATNQNLDELIKKKQFREDLYYRISTLTIDIPPLRDRIDDIEPLIETFIEKYSEGKDTFPIISPDVLAAMKSFDWPGNVRQLENAIEKLCILKPGRTVSIDDLPFKVTAHKKSTGKKELDREKVIRLLERHDWNVSKVARLLEIPISTFNRRIKKMGIKSRR